MIISTFENCFASILNKPVGESIVNDLEYDTVKSFIEKAISGIPVHAITTDHRREYRSIMDELKINQIRFQKIFNTKGFDTHF